MSSYTFPLPVYLFYGKSVIGMRNFSGAPGPDLIPFRFPKILLMLFRLRKRL